ncbi:ferric reductase-like transmembrane domain-containing protein [Prosthecomicrobium pneumaticum]|uniref:Protein-methionine-sulfoxide reductase heme-binding subunit MsrQ n=1 Tax=Prosthecomicrobium pneumaticum TaxID=81895 RepID=A0A7W9CV41_9HYPH|nr:sulfoxide reductase heme-binding subunit YedZ [Prosthecomicrobium pneumaticum]
MTGTIRLAKAPWLSKAPWLDRRGRFSSLKAIVFALLLLPAAILLWRTFAGTLGPRPITEVLHQLGLWAVRLIVIGLAVTPLRAVWRWPELIFVRRQIGLAAFFYALAHFVFYIVDLGFDLSKVASEIVLRYYLAIGFVALLLLVPLAVTSSDAMIRRLGPRWRSLHRLVYPVALLGIVHFFMQTKAGATEPLVLAGIALWLAVWRIVDGTAGARVSGALWFLVASGTLAVAATGLGEAAYYALVLRAPFDRVLGANLLWAAGWRPAWIVLALAVALVAVAGVRRRIKSRARGPGRQRDGGRPIRAAG